MARTYHNMGGAGLGYSAFEVSRLRADPNAIIQVEIFDPTLPGSCSRSVYLNREQVQDLIKQLTKVSTSCTDDPFAEKALWHGDI